MSDDSDRDLRAAFEELRAPASTAGYTTRTPGLEVPSSTRSRWPQALAAALAITLAIAGAGTFLALRSARQGGAPATSTSNPPARSGAAMAYDSTLGVTVMFGGTDAAGRPLTDTWTWNGTGWTAAAQGPGPMSATRLVDDPAAGGVLLVGMPAPRGSGVAAGCVGGGVASPGSVSSAGTPRAATTGAPIVQVSPPAGTPAVASAQPALPPLSTCPTAPAAPAEQTWLFSAHGWQLATGSAATAPFAGAQLAFDPTTRQVIAVSSNFLSCGPPRESAVGGGAIACPAMGGNSRSGAAPYGVPCDVPASCLGGGSVTTWTWSGRAWTKREGGTMPASGTVLLLTDPATGHATLMAQGASNGTCSLAGGCAAPLTPRTTTWAWTGSTWNRMSQVNGIQAGPPLESASVAAVTGHILVVTGDGQTWTFAAGQWTQDTVATHPSARRGAALAEGPSGTVVLFGGATDAGLAISSSGTPAGSLGSDTWVWNGSRWAHVTGAVPSPLPAPTACPGVATSPKPPCVGPPSTLAPATPAGPQVPAKGSPPPLANP
ncbi:MAG: hypothetical protein ACRENL_06585 [Candidatus Dormibacteria bacterium]